MTYSIRDWDAHFEKSQTRKCTAMKWVPVSNKHDGKSYRRLMRMERRAELYAVWVLLIQVASKCPTRGVLADAEGPLTTDDLELKTGMPAESFAYAMPVLASDAIGWLSTDSVETGSTLPADSQHATSTVVADYQHATSTLPASYQHGGAPVELQDRTGQDKTEQDKPPVSPKGERRRESFDPMGIEFPDAMQTDGFPEAWSRWVAYRQEITPRLKPKSWQAQAAAFIRYGPQAGVMAIDQSIASGWRGVFPDKCCVERQLGFRVQMTESKADIRRREEAEARRKLEEWAREGET